MAVNPGDTIMIEFSGTARHNGGICQFSLSYDNDANFFVIAEYNGSCPDGLYFDIDVNHSYINVCYSI